MDIFLDDYFVLNNEDSIFGSKSDNHLKVQATSYLVGAVEYRLFRSSKQRGGFSSRSTLCLIVSVGISVVCRFEIQQKQSDN